MNNQMPYNFFPNMMPNNDGYCCRKNDNRIDKLENSLDANSAALENTDSLTDLISKNADEIEKLKQKLTEQGII